MLKWYILFPVVVCSTYNQDKYKLKIYKFLFLFFTAEFSCKVEIFEQGGLEPIIKLLSSTDCDVQVLHVYINYSEKNI